MTREDYNKLADLVDEECFPEPEGTEQAVWNMAIKVAVRAILRAGSDAPWAPAPPLANGC